jgi:hypothetical protein
MELQACLEAGEVNRRVRGTTERLLIAAFEITGGDIEEPESLERGQRCGTCQPPGTRPRRHANAPHGADWSGVYELSKKLHRDANSTALRGRPILIGPPQRGQFQVRASEATGALGGSRG